MTFNIEELSAYPTDELRRPLVQTGDGSQGIVLFVGSDTIAVLMPNDFVFNYGLDGRLRLMHSGYNEDTYRIIGPWIEPKPEFDPTLCPKWCWGYARDEDGSWLIHVTPSRVVDGHWVDEGAWIMPLPPEHAPKWDGPWQESAILNPDYEEK